MERLLAVLTHIQRHTTAVHAELFNLLLIVNNIGVALDSSRLFLCARCAGNWNEVGTGSEGINFV